MAPLERRIAAPRPDPETKPFWDAASAGRLLLRRCRTCGRPHYFPRPLCPFCMSAETEWFEAAGTGEIYSYSVMRRAREPYCIAYVTLDEGVRMMTNIVDCDFDAIRVGMKVRLVFRESDGGPAVPMFAPS
jgi:uncharacterized OB-fold protein